MILFTQAVISDIIKRHDEDGESWNAIAVSLGVSRRTIAKFVNGDELPQVVVSPDWIHSAACLDEDPEFFEYEPERDPEEGDALARYYLAKEVCSGCPVRSECSQTASESDRLWTTRGGFMPLALRRRLKVA